MVHAIESRNSFVALHSVLVLCMLCMIWHLPDAKALSLGVLYTGAEKWMDIRYN